MQDRLTKAVSLYVAEKGIPISVISEKTHVPYNPLIASLSVTGTRKLRADEFLSVCQFLGVDPMKFLKFSGGLAEDKSA